MSATIHRLPNAGAPRRRRPSILLIAGAVVGLAALGHVLNPEADRQVVPQTPAASPLVDSRTFRNLCEAEARSAAARPETFRASHFFAGEPTRDGRAWRWSLPFEAANGFGAVGHYRADCSVAGDGRVLAAISLDPNP